MTAAERQRRYRDRRRGGPPIGRWPAGYQSLEVLAAIIRSGRVSAFRLRCISNQHRDLFELVLDGRASIAAAWRVAQHREEEGVRRLACAYLRAQRQHDDANGNGHADGPGPADIGVETTPTSTGVSVRRKRGEKIKGSECYHDEMPAAVGKTDVVAANRPINDRPVIGTNEGCGVINDHPAFDHHDGQAATRADAPADERTDTPTDAPTRQAGAAGVPTGGLSMSLATLASDRATAAADLETAVADVEAKWAA